VNSVSSYHWKVVADDLEIRKLFRIDGHGLLIPSPKYQISAELSGPQVYRFLFIDVAGKMRAYIGETKDFKCRLADYQKKGHATERNLRAQFGAGGLKEHFRLEFLVVDQSSLDDVHARRQHEAGAISEAKRTGIRTINSNRGSLIRGLNGKEVKFPSRKALYEKLDTLDESTK